MSVSNFSNLGSLAATEASQARNAQAEKQRLATGRDRRKALAVLMPRFLGALEQHGTTQNITRASRGLVVSEGDFDLHLRPERLGIAMRVVWRGSLAFTGELDFRCLGDNLGGRVTYRAWERGQRLGRWQHDLFEQFAHDSDRLLICAINDLPYIFAKRAGLDPVEIERMAFGRGPRTKSVAAELLWCQLLDACHRAAAHGVSLDELGSIALELGVGLRGFERCKDALARDLDALGRLVLAGEVTAVSVAEMGWSVLEGRSGGKSWIREVSGLTEPPAHNCAAAQAVALDRFRSYAGRSRTRTTVVSRKVV